MRYFGFNQLEYLQPFALQTGGSSGPALSTIITGTGYPGFQLSASTGTTYQWLSNGATIVGATTQFYMIPFSVVPGDSFTAMINSVVSNIILILDGAYRDPNNNWYVRPDGSTLYLKP